jgi:hypothetical protein
MSHETQDYTLFPIIEPEYPLLPIEQTNSIVQSPFFFIPDMPTFLREDFKGLEFEGVQYTWKEFDYRLEADYPSIPESADAGFFMAILVGIFVAYSYFKTRIK